MSHPARSVLTLLALAVAGTALLAQQPPRRPTETPTPGGGRGERPAPAPVPQPDRTTPSGGDRAHATGGHGHGGADRGRGTGAQGGQLMAFTGLRAKATPLPRGFAQVDRPRALPQPQSDRVLVPRATPHARLWPDEEFWRHRDIFKEIQFMARRGFIPVTNAGDAPTFTGECWFPSGWRCYGFLVPPGEKLHVRLHHPNEGWFRLSMMDRWGQLREGMLQNLIPTGNPEVSFRNPLKEATTVYVLVDDPGWMSSRENPFTLTVDRSWDPAKVMVPTAPAVVGIWAEVKLVPTEPGAEPKAPSADTPEARAPQA